MKNRVTGYRRRFLNKQMRHNMKNVDYFMKKSATKSDYKINLRNVTLSILIEVS